MTRQDVRSSETRISPELVVDFSAYAAVPADADQFKTLLDLRKYVADVGPDLLWTYQNGGHWIATCKSAPKWDPC